ncbi:MAG: BatD family protein [Phycisphaerae bacterium]
MPCAVWRLLLVVLAAPAAQAQQPSADLRIASADVYVNEPFLIEVVVENFKTCDAPQLPDLPGVVIASLPAPADTISTTILQGRVQQYRARTFRFELRATQPGAVTLGPATVRVDGRELRTRTVAIAVRRSDADELLFAEITTPAERVFVGQRVNLTLNVWVRPASHGTYVLNAQDMYSFFDDRTGWGPFTPPQRYSERKRALPDGGESTYYVYVTTTDYVPSKPGPLALDNVAVGFSYPTRFTRDVFGELRAAAVRRLRTEPTADEVQVLALPSAGRPANFTGAVGTFSIRTSTRSRSVRVGDPVELLIEIDGDGPLDTLPAPDLAADERLTAAFRVPAEQLAGEVQGGRKRFRQVIRPLRASVAEIPPIEYPYFDPAAEQYAVARSAPIPIEVSAAERLEAGELAGVAPPVEEPAPTEALDGLRGNETREERLLTARRPIGVGIVAAVTLAPPAVALLAWGWVATARLRTADESERRRASAARAARQRVAVAAAAPAAERVRLLGGVLPHYLADRWNEPPARFLGRAAADALLRRGVPAALVEECRALSDACDHGTFGGGAHETDELASRVQNCIDALERARI